MKQDHVLWDEKKTSLCNEVEFRCQNRSCCSDKNNVWTFGFARTDFVVQQKSKKYFNALLRLPKISCRKENSIVYSNKMIDLRVRSILIVYRYLNKLWKIVGKIPKLENVAFFPPFLSTANKAFTLLNLSVTSSWEVERIGIEKIAKNLQKLVLFRHKIIWKPKNKMKICIFIGKWREDSIRMWGDD